MKTNDRLVIFFITAGVCGQACAAIFDPAAAFSPSSNPNGVWSYGYSLTLGGPMVLYPYITVDNGVDRLTTEDNILPGILHNPTRGVVLLEPTFTAAIPPGDLLLHPGPANEFSILRFTAPADGQYAVAGLFYGDDLVGTTTDVHLLVNGSIVFDGAVDGFGLGTGPSFSMTEELKAGDHLDVIVGYGSNGNFSYDSTGVSMQVATGTDSPSPKLPNWSSLPDSGTTATMLMTALVGLIGCGVFGSRYCRKA
jgi:hypothetical protein